MTASIAATQEQDGGAERGRGRGAGGRWVLWDYELLLLFSFDPPYPYFTSQDEQLEANVPQIVSSSSAHTHTHTLSSPPLPKPVNVEADVIARARCGSTRRCRISSV